MGDINELAVCQAEGSVGVEPGAPVGGVIRDVARELRVLQWSLIQNPWSGHVRCHRPSAIEVGVKIRRWFLGKEKVRRVG